MTSLPQTTPLVTEIDDDLLAEFIVTPAPPDDSVYDATPPEEPDYMRDAPMPPGAVMPSATQDGEPPGYWQTQLHSLDTFLQRPKKTWLVDRIIGAGDFVLLYGESGHGKTHAVIDLAFSCLTGNTFADTFSVARPLTVAYATGEGVSGLADRMRAVSKHYGRLDLPLYIFADIPQLFDRNGTAGAVAFIHAWRAMADAGQVPAQLDILILDTLHNATAGADENSARDVSVIMQTLRLLRDALGCSIVLVHHSNKAGTDYRGSSSLKGAMDTMLRAQKTGKSFVMSCEKLKDGEAWPARSFELAQLGDTDEGVFVKWTGEVRTAAKTETHAARCLTYLRANAGNYFTADSITKDIGLTPGNIKNVLADLQKLVAAGTIQRDGGGRKGAPYRFGVDLLAGEK